MKSRWHIPLIMVIVFLHGAIEFKIDGESLFSLNRQCVKRNIGNSDEAKFFVDMSLREV